MITLQNERVEAIRLLFLSSTYKLFFRPRANRTMNNQALAWNRAGEDNQSLEYSLFFSLKKLFSKSSKEKGSFPC